jgi:hypothetical protein
VLSAVQCCALSATRSSAWCVAELGLAVLSLVPWFLVISVVSARWCVALLPMCWLCLSWLWLLRPTVLFAVLRIRPAVGAAPRGSIGHGFATLSMPSYVEYKQSICGNIT